MDHGKTLLRIDDRLILSFLCQTPSPNIIDDDHE